MQKVHVVLICALFPLASSENASAAMIQGHVRQSGTLEPLADALVSWQASGIRTTTFPDGSFQLDVPEDASVVIVAAFKGFFNQSAIVEPHAQDVLILLDPVPQDDDPSYPLMAPQTCRICHPNQYSEWNGSPMAKAGTNTWSDDLYSGLGTPGGENGFVYRRDSVFAEGNPNSECASCHQPEVWLQSPFAPLEDPTLPRSAQALHGISCEVCHKIADVNVSKINYPGLFPGAVTFTRPAGPDFHSVQYGLLGDADFYQEGAMRASYQPQLAAEVCAVCHQDASDPDENHTYTGPISEPTYLEWLESPYADPQSQSYASCVDCHMPPSGHDTVCVVLFPPLIRDPSTIRSHRIEGTTPEYLENAAELNLTVSRSGPMVHVLADVTNSGTGHHVPTGVTVRNMILLIEARQGDGAPLHYASEQMVHPLGGVGDPREGYYAGLPGKLYAKLIEDFDGNFPTFYTEAAAIVFDNRIAALQTDTTEYDFVAPGSGGEVIIEARLIYRRSFRAVVDTKQWTEDGHGNPLEDLASPHFGHLMESAGAAIHTIAGDFDGDDDADLTDYVPLRSCLWGPTVEPEDRECFAFDVNADGHIDLLDIRAFQSALGGS